MFPTDLPHLNYETEYVWLSPLQPFTHSIQ